MGRGVIPNKVLDHRVLHLILAQLNSIIINAATASRGGRWMVMVGSCLLITFATSLQGNKGFIVEVHGLITNIPHGREVYEIFPHVVIPFM